MVNNMTNITPQYYINTLSFAEMATASVYFKVIDPWVVSGTINSTNTNFLSEGSVMDGVTAYRAPDSAAIPITTRTIYEPAGGYKMKLRTSVSMPGIEYRSRHAEETTKGELLDVSIMNQLIRAEIGGGSVDYFVNSVASAGLAVYRKMIIDRLTMVFSNQFVKEDADGTGSSGTSTSFTADCPHADVTQVVDLTAVLSGTTTAAMQGYALHMELLNAIRPVRRFNNWCMAEIHLPEEVFEKYTMFLDAAIRSGLYVDMSMRRDDLTKSRQVTATYGQSYTLVNMGAGADFPQGGSPADQFNCLITMPGALRFYYDMKTTGHTATFNGSPTLAQQIPDVMSYINNITSVLASERGSYNFARQIAANDTNPGIWSMMQQSNFGTDALFNVLSSECSKLQYGVPDAMHYFLQVNARQVVLRHNPALLRKWIVPFAKAAAPSVYGMKDISFSVRKQQTSDAVDGAYKAIGSK